MSKLDNMPEDVYDTQDVNSMFKYMEQLAKIIYSKENIELITDITPSQIEAICQIEYDDIHILKDWGIDMCLTELATTKLKLHNVSKNRQSRPEFVSLFQNIFEKALHGRSMIERILPSGKE